MINSVETRVHSYEIQGESIKGLHDDRDDLIVIAHRINRDFVTLDWHGRTITVAKKDLLQAVHNSDMGK